MSKGKDERNEEKLWGSHFVKVLKLLAPGTLLREGIDNVLKAKMGALVLFANKAEMLEIVDGGFALNAPFTPAGFYELAKMDGALVLSGDGKTILYANAQLVPDATLPTSETGTRHRTAERTARQTGGLVIAISQRRNVINLYLANLRYTLSDIPTMLSRSNQALQTLEKYRLVLTKGLNTLSALEFEDLVTLNDVASVLVRAEHVQRMAREIECHIIELGTEGRLVNMQMEELLPEEDPVMTIVQDYCVSGELKSFQTIRRQIGQLPEDELDPYHVCRLLGYGVTATSLDLPVVPRGYRVLNYLPRLPQMVVQNLVAHFKTLPRIYSASLSELDEVEGIGESRAKTIKDGLKRVREQAVLDRQF